MNDPHDDLFDLPVTYKGQLLHFPARLLNYGYTHKIRVEVYGVEVLLEPDEERNYRAVVDNELAHAGSIDKALLAEIVSVVESIVK